MVFVSEDDATPSEVAYWGPDGAVALSRSWRSSHHPSGSLFQFIRWTHQSHSQPAIAACPETGAWGKRDAGALQ